VAEWNDDAGLQPLNAKYVRLRPHVEFEKNRTYIVTTVREEPYIMEKQPAFGEKLHGNERYEGYCKDLADLLAKELGINCKWMGMRDALLNRACEFPAHDIRFRAVKKNIILFPLR